MSFFAPLEILIRQTVKPFMDLTYMPFLYQLLKIILVYLIFIQTLCSIISMLIQNMLPTALGIQSLIIDPSVGVASVELRMSVRSY